MPHVHDKVITVETIIVVTPPRAGIKPPLGADRPGVSGQLCCNSKAPINV